MVRYKARIRMKGSGEEGSFSKLVGVVVGVGVWIAIGYIAYTLWGT
jgi:hypothetical protein